MKAPGLYIAVNRESREVQQLGNGGYQGPEFI
jgi:hypothetical protein